MTDTPGACVTTGRNSPIARKGGPLAMALAGLAALAVAMGIGRFAFTPMLPMMQADGTLTVAEGGLLAAANYLGYLLGALTAAWIRLSPGWSIRGGLAAICAGTLSMALTGDFHVWLVLRFVAGVASALVLIHVTAWSLQGLAALNAPRAGGIVFAGVGAGIAAAGLLCLAAMRFGLTAAWSWGLLGAAAGAGLAAVWSSFAPHGAASRGLGMPAAPAPGSFSNGIWIFCYGVFGFGYILPATFLPAMARQMLPDPAWFGWVWPVFGAAAFLSTLAAARLVTVWGARRLWAASHAAMALGVMFPLFFSGLAGLLIAALLVGGTFMVATMAAMQHARAVAGIHATRLIAAMTAAFAAGQVIGPLAVSAMRDRQDGGLAIALSVSGALLLLTAVVLAVAGTRKFSTTS